MKKRLFAAIVPFTLLSASAAFADTETCATKIRAIESQIEAAKQFSNAQRVAGLQAALQSTKAGCTDAGQAARAEHKVRDAQQDVHKAQEDVHKSEDKLREARANGNARKIAKAEKKLADQEDKLRDKMDNLRSAQADLAALKG